MRFGQYRQEEPDLRFFVIPSDSYIDKIAETAGIWAIVAGVCNGVYHLSRDRANTVLRARMVNVLTHTPRAAAMVAGYSLISSSVVCSLVALRGKGDTSNAFFNDFVFYGLLARRRGPVITTSAGLLGGTITHHLGKWMAAEMDKKQKKN